MANDKFELCVNLALFVVWAGVLEQKQKCAEQERKVLPRPPAPRAALHCHLFSFFSSVYFFNYF